MIIWGSSRTGRQGGVVADWVRKSAEADSRFEVDFVDLKELNLPFFNEPISPFSMASAGKDYTVPAGKAWAERVAKTDGVLIVTPEYNHGYSGVLKNALDWVGLPWRDKPVGFVSYGGIGGGARAVEQLRQVVVELGLIQVANAIHFPFFPKAFDDQGQPLRPENNDSLKKMFDEIVRLKQALSQNGSTS